MFDLAVIDPPWPKKMCGKRKARPGLAKTLPYDTMTVDEIYTLLDDEVFSQMNNQHTIFLWTIDAFLHESEEKMKERGYKLHTRMIWNKINGIPAAFTVRYSHEYLLWYYKPKLTKVSEESRGKLGTVFTENNRQHSRKPEISYKNIEFWYPNAKKIDVFSREKRVGWEQFGNEVDHFAEI